MIKDGALLVALFFGGWLMYSGVNQVVDNQEEERCDAASVSFRANSMCYRDSSCMITGEDFRVQLEASEYLKENCPDEWETVQGSTEDTGIEEADPGLSVWSGEQGTTGR
jgi:hypothetical protein